jgi:tetratricopeptide (TPR) repeat protein
MQEKKFFAACTAFEQSQRLDPQAGTQYNLALCYTEIGKLASALNLHRELVRYDKNVDRQQSSNKLAIQLAARVPRIKLNLVGMPADISVFMNGTNVNALIGIESPVDFGTYTIVVGAPGYRGWRKTIEVKQEGELVTVDIDLGPPMKP